MIEELKPCPFCGGKAYLFVRDGVRVMCGDCNATTIILVDSLYYGKPSGNVTDEVIKKWNSRVGEEGD